MRIRRRRFVRAWNLTAVALGPDHPDTMADISNLASTLLYEHHYPEAEKLYRDLVPNLRRVLGPEHPRTLLSAGNLALVLHDEHREAEAEKLFRETLEVKRKKLGPEHRSTLVTMGNLAEVLTPNTSTRRPNNWLARLCKWKSELWARITPIRSPR